MQTQKRSKAQVWWLVGGVVILLLGLLILLRGRVAGLSGGANSTGQQTGSWLSVRIFPDQQGWAVTFHGILHTTDGGQHWTDVTPWTADDYQFGGRTDELADFANGQQIWLILPARTVYLKAGEHQQPELARSFLTTDGGKTWHKGAVPETGNTYSDTMSGAGFAGGLLRPLNALGEDRGQVGIDGLSVLGTRDAWVSVVKTATHTGAGQESIITLYSRIWHSTDGGQTWHLAMDEKPTGNNPVLDEGWITFLSSTTGLMAGPTLESVRISHDGGATWQIQHLPASQLTPLLAQRSRQQRAIFFDSQHGVLPIQTALDNQHSELFTYTTHDGGKTWHESRIQRLISSSNAFYLDAQHWMQLADNHTLLATADGGNTWSGMQTSIGSPYLGVLTFASSQQGWAIGRAAQYLQSGQYSQDGSTVLWQTSDGGKTWKKVNYII